MGKPLDPRFDEYVEGVRSGRICVGGLVRLAVERHLADLEHGHERGLVFDDDEANFAIAFLECLCHSKGEWAGQPIRLQPWQVFLVGSLFGWWKFDAKAREKTRRFNIGFVLVAKKNGKSLLGAAIGNKCFVADGEPGAEVYAAATKRDQAKIVFGEARRMVLKSPALAKVVTVHQNNMAWEETGSKFEPLGAEAVTDEGFNLSAAICDELHLHPTREVWDLLDSSTAARRNPLIFVISTAGEAGNLDSIYHEQKDYAIKVLEGRVEDDSYFAYLATLDKKGVAGAEADDDWTDEANWLKANPNLGVSVKLDDLRRKAKKAQETPGAAASFRRRHCNEDTYTLSPWMPAEHWDRCKGDLAVGSDFDPERFRGRRCAVGCDLSSVSDLTAVVFAFPDDDGGVDVVPFAWCPRDNAIGRQRDKRVPYLDWAERGLIRLTEGDSVDYDAIRELLRRARKEWGWRVRRIAFDPTNARYLMTKLVESDGWQLLEGEGDRAIGEVYERLQTTNGMNDPIGLTEKLVLDQKLRHGGHPVLAWCVSNVICYSDTGGRRRFDKRRAREKIDLAVAAVMATYDAMHLPSGSSAGIFV